MKPIFVSIVFVLIIVFLCPQRIYSSVSSQLITDVSVYDNDSTLHYSYLYDTKGNVVLKTKYYLDNTNWVRHSQTEWVYNASKCIMQRENVWRNSNWETDFKIEYSYDSEKLILENHAVVINGISNSIKKINFSYSNSLLNSKQEFVKKNNDWNLVLRTDFVYLPNAAVDTLKISVLNGASVLQQFQSVYTYYPDGAVASEWMQEKKAGTNWQNVGYTNWFYKGTEKLVLFQRNKKWDNNFSQWVNSQNIEYVYNQAGKLISETYQYWENAYWQNDIRYLYEFDGNGIMLKKKLLKPIYKEWKTLVSVNYSDFKNSKANLIESKFEFWGGNTGELTTSFIAFDFNDKVTIQKAKSIKLNYLPVDLNATNRLAVTTDGYVSVYPNPSSGIFYINTSDYAVHSWSISDLNGRLLKQHVQDFQSGVIDLTELTNGIYILKVNTESGQLVQKLVKK